MSLLDTILEDLTLNGDKGPVTFNINRCGKTLECNAIFKGGKYMLKKVRESK